MAETAHELLELLEQRQLVSEKVLKKLRKKVDDSSKDVSARKLAKILVDKGLITSVQARELLKTRVQPTDVKSGPSVEAARPGNEVEQNDRPPQPPVTELDGSDDEPELVDPKSSALLEAADDPLDDDALMLDDFEERSVGPGEVQTAQANPLDDELDATGTATKSRKPLRLEKRRWDSPLILVGSGALLLLIALGVFLFFYLQRGTAQEMFNLAEEDKTAGRYRSAISNYENFLKKYPKDVNVSKAHVRIGMCGIWQEVEAKSWKRSLEVAKEILPTIETEEQFGETARPELAGLLSNIAEGFAEQAHSVTEATEQQGFVDEYTKAMELVDNPVYVPGSMKQTIQPKLDDIAATVATVRRDIDRDRELAAAIVAIREFTAADERDKAYAAQTALLKIYPALGDHPDLRAAIGEISQKQRDAVKVSDDELLASNEDHPTPTHVVAVASRVGKAADGVGDRVLFVAASGAVYALKAASGEVLWRRYVGHESQLHPMPLTVAGSDDVLAVDGRRHELLRLGARTNKLIWRLSLNEPLLGCKIFTDSILAVTKSGKLFLVDVEDGASRKQVILPQALSALPGLDEKRGRLYVASEHSNLFVLSSNSLSCDEVYYLGHKPGAVMAPPATMLGLVFVTEVLNSKISRMHVLAMENTGLGLRPAQNSFRLQGHVVTPPLVMGRRLLVTTNLGAVYLFEIDKSAEANPVKEIGKTAPTNELPIRPYIATANGQLFVGGNRLSRYLLQASRGSITRKAVAHRGDAFVGPLQILDKTLFCVRRRAEKPGTTVAAIDIESMAKANGAAQAIWETDLAVPLAGEPFVSASNKIILMTAQAELFEMGKEEISRRLDDRPDHTGKWNRPGALNGRIPLSDGRQIFVSDAQPNFVVLYDPTDGEQLLRAVDLPVEPGSLTNAPTVFDGGLLATSDIGQIYLVSLGNGGKRVHPFQPTLAAGQRIQWRRPAVVHAGTTQAIIWDGDGKLYRLGVSNDRESQLKAMAEREVEWSLDRPLAAVEDTVYGVASGEVQDLIVTFAVVDLEPGQKWELDARVTWGPEPVGDSVFVTTDKDELYCFTVGQSLKWKVQLPYGTIVGSPLALDGMYYFVAQKGIVWRTNNDTGEDAGHVDIGEPLGTGLAAIGPKFVVAGNDGTMYAFERQSFVIP